MSFRDLIKWAFYSIMPRKMCINHIYSKLQMGGGKLGKSKIIE